MLSNFHVTIQAFKIILLYYTESKTGNYGDFRNAEKKYDITFETKKQNINNTYMLTGMMHVCV